MRIRLFLSFAVIIAITLAILGFVIQTNTQTTLASFAQSGAFFGADRTVRVLASYYQETGSWDQIDQVFDMDDHMTSPGGGPGGMGMGHQGGPGFMFMDRVGAMGQFSLADRDGTILASDSLTAGEQVSGQVLAQSYPIEVKGQVVGYLVPESGLLDLSELIRQELTAALSGSLLPTALVSGAIALVLAVLLAAFLMRPVRQLTHAADQVAAGDLSQRVPVTGRDELGQLATTFNQMADSLQRAQKSRQAMTADIAHELRTPLSVQRANLEALQDGIYPLTQENLTPIIQQNQLLTKLVDDLRTLALADAGALNLEKVPTDLAGLLARICSDFEPAFAEAGIELHFTPEPEIPTLTLDPARINQVINNLLQNSLRHTPTGGRVEVSLVSQPGMAVIQIRDTGEGIPEEALPLLFERFYRSDHARSRDTGGTGLGLTIARQMVEAHHGSLTAANHPAGGAVFEIRLPAG